MANRTSIAFAALVASQALHSLEEYHFRLFDVLAPARRVSSLVSLDPATGFAFVNTALVLFGLWSWLGPVRRSGRAGRILAAGWAIVEIGNGAAHSVLAALAGGYFPGLYTAPLLLAAGAWLLQTLRRSAVAREPRLPDCVG